MPETTLCYIERDGKYLMLHRVKKENDVNKNKWIGIGGKFEEGESPEECMRREILEETGLEVIKYSYRGIVTFVSENSDSEIVESEYMHLFHISEFRGEPGECDEGDLEWVQADTLSHLPHWKGDLIFLSLLMTTQAPFFSLKLRYKGDELIQALLNEKPVFVTERLILRPWLITDAEALYRYASDPGVGPMAGWPVHTSAQNSREIIEGVLSEPDTYAIVRIDTGEPIGSVGLMLAGREKDIEPGNGEIGYWIGRPFWGNGYIPEAAREMMRRGFEDHKCSRVFVGYYDGNEKSKRVSEKCGFHFDHTTENKDVPLLHKKLTEHFTVMTAEEYFAGKKAN